MFELRSMTQPYKTAVRKLKARWPRLCIFYLGCGHRHLYPYIVFNDFFFFKVLKTEAFVSVSLTLLKQTIEELRSKLTQQETNMPPDGNLRT